MLYSYSTNRRWIVWIPPRWSATRRRTCSLSISRGIQSLDVRVFSRLNRQVVWTTSPCENGVRLCIELRKLRCKSWECGEDRFVRAGCLPCLPYKSTFSRVCVKEHVHETETDSMRILIRLKRSETPWNGQARWTFRAEADARFASDGRYEHVSAT